MSPLKNDNFFLQESFFNILLRFVQGRQAKAVAKGLEQVVHHLLSHFGPLLIFIFQEPRNENVQPPVDDCRRRRNEFSVVEQSSYKVLFQTLILYFTFYLKPGQTHLSVGWWRGSDFSVVVLGR